MAALAVSVAVYLNVPSDFDKKNSVFILPLEAIANECRKRKDPPVDVSALLQLVQTPAANSVYI